MKRLLLVAYAFPPQPSPGALRPGYLARLLPSFGWNVTVLTNSPHQPPFPVEYVSAGGKEPQLDERVRAAIGNGNPDVPLRRLLRAVKDTLLFPDATAPWIPHAIARGLGALREHRFDAIMSTALPSSVHIIGSYLARTSALAWVADYRDGWSGNPYFHWGPVRKVLQHATERRCLARAAALTTVNDPIAQHLRTFHRRNDVSVIPNAYDPSEWDAIPQTEPHDFTLCYTGSLYDGKRDPEMLFQAIRELSEAGHPAATRAQVHFYGRNSDNVARSAARFGVAEHVHQHATVPRDAAMRAQRSSAVLLLLLNLDPATAGEMGSKYLEYIGAGRPILAIGPRDSEMRRYIESNGIGWFASDVEETKRALTSSYERFQSGAYTIARPAGLQTTAGLAASFAHILNRVSGCAPEVTPQAAVS